MDPQPIGWLGQSRRLEPDVILMDLRMPGMDGLTAITELARQGSAARVLVLTRQPGPYAGDESAHSA